MKNSALKEDQLPDDAGEIILDKKIRIVTTAIKNDFTTKQAAKRANVSVSEIYGWFMKGRDGDEMFEEFSEIYYDEYVAPGSRLFQIGIHSDAPLSFIFKKCKNVFTREDHEFWLENGFLKEAQEKLDKEDDEETMEMESSIFKN